jgi:AraC-like DNA-binding protein
MSLSEVAEQVGYDDYVYFSKNFKAVTGVSPREYLKAKIHGKELDISEDEIGYGTGLF